MIQQVDEPFIVVIPARYDSTRFPGKPLAEIAGRPMVLHVFDQAMSSGAQQVLIATDDERIADVAQAHGATALMTQSSHASGTDRIAEVSQQLEWPANQIVVNVQGDEPLIPPGLIAQVAGLLAEHQSADVATLTTRFLPDEDPADVGFAKVITDAEGFAIYFSRAVIPYARDDSRPEALKRHVGIYAYRVAALQKLTAAGVCELEALEKLEQLRCLWLGMRIIVADACAPPARGVDTPEDLAVIRAQIN